MKKWLVKNKTFKQGGDCSNEGLFYRAEDILLVGRDEQTRAALDKVNKSKKRLYWGALVINLQF